MVTRPQATIPQTPLVQSAAPRPRCATTVHIEGWLSTAQDDAILVKMSRENVESCARSTARSPAATA
jgi:hypothetical protein